VRADELARFRPRLVDFTAQMLQGAVRQWLGVDHQRLQQFVTSSTWDYERVRANVGRWAAEVIDPDAFVVDDCGFSKDGTASPCVARQYSGHAGQDR
jgi:SRSO17 transposase